MTTEEGTRIYAQPEETWIEVAVPPLVDEETWERAQQLKKQRLAASKRNTKVFYLLQHLLRCTECGLRFRSKAKWGDSNRRNGKRVLQDPALIVAGINALGDREDGGFVEEIAKAERELRTVQMEEDRAIRLYVSGKITEDQLDLQRKFITERLESLRAKVDDYRAREASGVRKRDLTEAVLAWARDVGEGLDELSPEQRKEVLRMVVDEVMVDRDNNLDITLAIPINDDSVSIASQSSPEGERLKRLPSLSLSQ